MGVVTVYGGQGSKVFDAGGAVLNVKARRFGGSGLGSLDDYASIQAALDATPDLAGTGIEIWAPPGQYNLTAPLLLRGSTRFRCAGANLTQLYGPGVTGALIKNPTPATVINHVVLEGFTINGGNSTTLTAGIDWTGVNTPTLKNIEVRNINTTGAAGFTANGTTADSSSATLRDCGAYNITAGQGFKFQSVNGVMAINLKGQFNQETFLLNSVTESNFYGLLTSDDTGTGDASALKVQNCNRTNIVGFGADDAKWITVFVNGSTQCNFSDFWLNDNNQPFSVGNGGLLYVAGAKRCNFHGIVLEFVAAAPVAGTNGLTLDNTSAGQIQDCTFTGLTAFGTGSANVKPIHWVAGASGLRNQYKAVAMTGFATTSFEVPLETDVHGSFDCRAGIVTRSSGVPPVGTGAQQTVPHGLKFTPTRDQIALISGSATANPWHSAAPDATNIYVTAASTQPWYWATVG